jgi:rhodanese-related sulfurtransferase
MSRVIPLVPRMAMSRSRLAILIAAACVLIAAPLGAVGAGGYPTVTPAQVAEWQERGEAFLLVDVRPSAQYDLKHARAALNIPAFAIGSKPLPGGVRVVLYDGGAGSPEAEQAARSLQAKGHAEFYVMEGGLTAWEGLALPIVAQAGPSAEPLVEPINGEDLLRLIDSGARVTIIDLRPGDQHRASRVPGAVSAPTEVQRRRATAGLQPTDLIVIYDEGDGSARKKAEDLRRQGFRAVRWLYGGMAVWRDRNLRVER